MKHWIKDGTRTGIFLGGANFVELPAVAAAKSGFKTTLISKAMEVGANAVHIAEYPTNDNNQ